MGFTLMVALPLHLKEIWELGGQLRGRVMWGPQRLRQERQETLPPSPCEPGTDLTKLRSEHERSIGPARHKSRQEPWKTWYTPCSLHALKKR